MQEILFLAHRIPYPPDKGDKIRSYRILRHLAQRYRVHLGCFVDSPRDSDYIGELRKLCGEVFVCRIAPVAARFRSLDAFRTNSALSLPYYYSSELNQWVNDVLTSRPVSAAIAYSSPMAQYLMAGHHTSLCRVMDFVDVDSDKWQQYADKKSGLMKIVYRREARLLLEFERAVANAFDAVAFVSRNERGLFDRLSPDTVQKHYALENGVDLEFFDSELKLESPYPSRVLPIVFTGMMNYWPNVDAMIWFTTTILPSVLRKEPCTELWIVGSSPTRAVEELGRLPGVRVTGRVPDVRPYLKHAAVAIAPLRIARGVQNKVLEALAMGCVVVSSPDALAGLKEVSIAPVHRATVVREWVEKVIRALHDAGDGRWRDGREYVRRHYDWGNNLKLLEQLLVAKNESSLTPASREASTVIYGK